MRQFGVSALAAAFLPKDLFAERVSQDKVLLGDGKHKYEWITGWAKLPDGLKYCGSTHGNVQVDSKDNVYFNTDTDNAVMVFDPEGKHLRSFGKEYRGAHGMWIRKDGDQEVLWLCSLGRSEVVKMTLGGEVLLTIPFPEKSGVYKEKKEYKPTGVTVGPNGDVYVGDGYGKSWCHRFSAKGEYLSSWNGEKGQAGKFSTPHGMCLDLRGAEPRIIVADRGNHRLQVFTLECEYVSVVNEGLRSPCTAYIHGEDIVVPDLQGRITLLDKENKLIAHLGENEDKKKQGNFNVKPEDWKDGQFTAPHGAAWDSKGDLYVEDWNVAGRFNKLKKIG
jgi:sugar lactone lactonase YvrE